MKDTESTNDALPPDVNGALKAAVEEALRALEQAGVSAREADEFVRDCVFEAWWDWDYEGPDDA
jgi:hypothetical protein